MSEPKIHVFVTSQMMDGGAQNSITRMSARARFTMKMLVTLCAREMARCVGTISSRSLNYMQHKGVN